MKQKENFKEFSLSSWAIDNRITVYVLTAIILLLGILAYVSLPKENFPEITVPTMYVGTIYPGSSPESIEEKVSYHIEKEIKAIKGVKWIKSNSIQDFSVVIVEFETNVDLKEAKRQVQEAVDKAKGKLPKDLPQDPMVQEINLSELPIMFVNISGNLDKSVLKRYADDLADEIETLPEIQRVDLAGDEKQELQINLDLYKMTDLGISFGDVEGALLQRDVLISGGQLQIGTKDYTLQISGKFAKPSEMGNVLVRNPRGAQAYLNDLIVDSTIAIRPKEAESFARLNGENVLTLNVIKKGGENLVFAADKITDMLKEFEENNISPEHKKSIKFTISQDQSYMTRNMLGELTNSVIIGFILVTLMLMFYMGLRDAMFVGLSIPIASLIAFAIMPWIGFTLNMIVLFTFIFALGVVVDNAIVVIENIHRIYNTEGLTITQSAKKAAGEVIMPVIAGTMIHVAPFLPLAFWEGVIGEFMFFLPITIMITLTASILVAYVINPVFAVTFMRRDKEASRMSIKGFFILFGILLVLQFLLRFGGNTEIANSTVILLIFMLLYRFLIYPAVKWFQTKGVEGSQNFYRRILSWSVRSSRNAVILISGTVGVLIIAVMVIGSNPPKTIFFPEADPNLIFVYNNLEISTNVNETNRVTRELEARVESVLKPHRDIVKSVITNVSIGAGDQMDFNRTNPIPHKSKISIEFIEFKKRNGISTTALLSDIRNAVKGVPGTVVTVEKEQGGPPTSKPINIEVKGDNFDEIKVIASDLKGFMEEKIKNGDLVGVEELKWDLEVGKKELVYDVDFGKASELGMSAAQIGMTVRTAVFGKEIGQYRELEDEYPIMIRLGEEYRKDQKAIEDITIPYMDMASMMFHKVPVSAVAHIDEDQTYNGINRKDLKKIVTIASNVLTEYNPNEVVYSAIDVMNEWKDANKQRLKGITVEMTGQIKEQEETGAFLGGAFGASMLLIFLVLISQFNNIARVFIIMFQIVLCLIGTMLGFSLAQMEVSIVMVGIGMVALTGLVVSNGILLLDFIHQQQASGVRFRKSIVEGSALRLNPVLLTAGSTVIGMVPTALSMNIDVIGLFTELNPHIWFGGDSAAFWGPLSWTIIFGLSFATFVTLIVLPTVYYASYVNGIWIKRKLRRIRQKFAPLLYS